MTSITKRILISRAVHYLLLIVIVLYFVTGFGITEFRVVEVATFGLLTKSVAFKIHLNLWIPLIVFLILHIYLSLTKSR